MRLPAINEIATSVVITDTFRGYNHNRVIQDNEFFEMQNLSSDDYPMLSPRQQRRIKRSFQEPHGIYTHEKLCWADGTNFYYDGELKGTVSASDKQFISMGAYVIIWPDKKIYNSQDDSIEDLGVLDEEALPVWTNTSGYPELTKYSIDVSGEMMDCMRINTIEGAFHKDDVITILYKEWKGDEEDPSEGEEIDRKLTTKVVEVGVDSENNTGFVFLPFDNDFASIYTSALDPIGWNVTLERAVPDMDYVCELNNRLWGCSTDTNELFCSALGNAFNWYVYNGDSQDSWAVNVGTTGPFTGICTYQNNILFFKEDHIHMVYGTRPSNFQVSTLHCQGVEDGSSRSICILNERVYYKSKRGVCIYSGGQPSLISDALGDVEYTGASAAAFGDKIYISMTEISDPLAESWDESHGELLVYDTITGLWHKEGREHIRFFTVYDGCLLFVGEDNKLYSVGADQDGELEKCVEWNAQTGRILFRTPDHKHISKVRVRATLFETTRIRIDMRYDGKGPWHKAAERISRERLEYIIPIIPRRCEYFEMRLSGVGEMRLISVSYNLEQGSEV